MADMDGIIVEKIPINRFFRKRVKFWFGMWTWVQIADKHNVSIDDLSTIPTESIIPDTLYFAADWAAYKDGKRFGRVTYKQIEKSLDLMPQKQLQRIIKCMMESKVGGRSIMDVVGDSKKKQAQKS